MESNRRHDLRQRARSTIHNTGIVIRTPPHPHLCSDCEPTNYADALRTHYGRTANAPRNCKNALSAIAWHAYATHERRQSIYMTNVAQPRTTETAENRHSAIPCPYGRITGRATQVHNKRYCSYVAHSGQPRHVRHAPGKVTAPHSQAFPRHKPPPPPSAKRHGHYAPK